MSLLVPFCRKEDPCAHGTGTCRDNHKPPVSAFIPGFPCVHFVGLIKPSHAISLGKKNYMVRVVTFSADSIERLEQGLQEAQGANPTLGFLFASPYYPLNDVAGVAARAGIPFFGVSTAGEILPKEDEPAFSEHTIAAALLDLDPALFRVSVFPRQDSESSFTLGSRIGKWGCGHFQNPHYIIGLSGFSQDGEAVIKGVQGESPAGTGIFGGIAGDDSRYEATFTFSGSGITTDGAVVLLLDGDRVSVSGTTSSGWEGVGTEMIITSAEGNVVSLINGQPAAEVVKEHLNVTDDEILELGMLFPLIVTRRDGSQVIRTFLQVDRKTGALTFAGTIPQGSRVRFSGSFGFETIQQTIHDLRAFHRDHPDAEFILLVSCMARRRAAGPLVADEILTVTDLWKAPTAGFFSYGEIGPCSATGSDLFNETLSVVLISTRTRKT